MDGSPPVPSLTFRVSPFTQLCYTFAEMQTAVPPAIEAVNVSRRFTDVAVLDNVTLTIPRGEFFTLLGPSGCGKTTFLRIVAGLDYADSGSLHLAGKDASELPAHRRAVNTVFQSYALFPHLTVRGNVEFGLRMKKLPRPEIATRVRGVMELTRIAELADRKPFEISGGQRQRVALARALVNEPEVLLLDEPLGALDLKLRKELQAELRSLQRRTGITFVYVTHDQDEALSMSDRIAVMNHGRIVQLGSSEELYERPRTRFVAQFLGGCNLLPARVHERVGNDVITETALGKVLVRTADPRNEFTLAIRPEKILVSNGSAPNQFNGDVVETTYTGVETQVAIRISQATMRVTLVNRETLPQLRPGASIQLTLPPERLVILED